MERSCCLVETEDRTEGVEGRTELCVGGVEVETYTRPVLPRIDQASLVTYIPSYLCHSCSFNRYTTLRSIEVVE